MTQTDINGWSEYEKMILFRLTALENKLDRVERKLQALEVRAAIYGGVAGFVITIVPTAVQLLAML